MSENTTPDLDNFDDDDETPFFMGSANCGCALSEAENDCVSRKIKTLLAEGKSRKQAVAIAISMCEGESAKSYETAKEKQRSKFINPDGSFKKGFDGCVDYQMKTQGLDRESAEKLCAYIGRKAGKIKKQAEAEYADKPSLPGGEYEAVQNPDGSWNINDVPIFAEHTVRMGDGKNIEIGKEWMEEALVVTFLRCTFTTMEPAAIRSSPVSSVCRMYARRVTKESRSGLCSLTWWRFRRIYTKR